MAPAPRFRGIATAVSLFVVAAYVGVTLLFVNPPNPVTGAFSAVKSASTPYFAQEWNVFAPDIARSNPQLRVQAQWRDARGELVKSRWVNVTEIEFAAVEGHPLPSRVQKLSWNALSSYLSRFDDLAPAQRLMVQDTFIERSGAGFRGIPPEELVDSLSELGDDRGAAIGLLRADFALKEYLTYFATASFGQQIERVRWEVYRERPNDFERQFDSVAQHAPTTLRFGWRQADDAVRPEALAAFEEVIARYGDGS
ncbi:DUF5819 family protein [Microbacterium invictum]|uniref:DUF5819 family protein n=1 Tax=Microbacterium invictum TaxID=515415 RepID=A0ABZ0VAR2_9MICO|nr:DUF5819 family protein [Microbacterium invictum]WQB69781.1 DUF5819 family protein [Microbacterium invictum]